ncbi:hypothetical protein AABB24_006466 [Solanum stoloniferum]|uniref:Uncharacterized protein n=1 Tax=Solanum stoloniferum TaxID=62892 RepID=A0ABD2V2R7_9SOLN
MKQFIHNTRKIEKIILKERSLCSPLKHLLVVLHGLKPLQKQLLFKLVYEILRTFIDIFRWLALQLLWRCRRLPHICRIRPLYLSGEILHRPFCFFLNFFHFGCAVVTGIQGTTHFLA